MKSRSEVRRPSRVAVEHVARQAAELLGVDPRTIRTPDGDIDNCAVANGEPEEGCQICKGTCPDRGRFHSDPNLTANAGDRKAFAALCAHPNPQQAVADAGTKRERAIKALHSAAYTAASSHIPRPLLFEGDVVRAEVGPIEAGPIRVGRVQVETRLRPLETAADAYLRARQAAALMFDVEVATCLEEHACRVGPQGVAKLLEDFSK